MFAISQRLVFREKAREMIPKCIMLSYEPEIVSHFLKFIYAIRLNAVEKISYIGWYMCCKFLNYLLLKWRQSICKKKHIFRDTSLTELKSPWLHKGCKFEASKRIENSKNIVSRKPWLATSRNGSMKKETTEKIIFHHDRIFHPCHRHP